MGIDWSQLYHHRHEVARLFGDIWSIPLDKRYHTVLARCGAPGCHLLEVGAGDRTLQHRMKGYWGEFNYSSCDIDASHPHEFGHIDEVTGTFDLICAFELIEHLSLADAQHLLARCFDQLSPGGRIALSTPNIYYPPGFLRDATHVTPFCYDELGGLLSLCGFRVSHIFRLHHDSLWKKFIKRYLAYPLFRLLGIDFAKQIMVVAEKPQASAPDSGTADPTAAHTEATYTEATYTKATEPKASP